MVVISIRRTYLFIFFSIFIISVLPAVQAESYRRINAEIELIEEDSDILLDITDESQSNYNITWEPFIDEHEIEGALSSAMLPPSIYREEINNQNRNRIATQFVEFDYQHVMEGSSIQWWRAPFNRLDGFDVDIKMSLFQVNTNRLFDVDYDDDNLDEDDFYNFDEDEIRGGRKIYSENYIFEGENFTTGKMHNVEWEYDNKTVNYNMTYCRSYTPIYSDEEYAVVWQWRQESDEEEVFVTQSDAGNNDFYKAEIVLDRAKHELDMNLLTDVMHEYGQSSMISGDNIQSGSDVSFKTHFDDFTVLDKDESIQYVYFFYLAKAQVGGYLVAEYIMAYSPYLSSINEVRDKTIDDTVEAGDFDYSYYEFVRFESMGYIGHPDRPPLEYAGLFHSFGEIDTDGNYIERHDNVIIDEYNRYDRYDTSEDDWIDPSESHEENFNYDSSEGMFAFDDYFNNELFQIKYTHLEGANAFTYTMPIHRLYHDEVEISVDYTFYHDEEEKFTFEDEQNVRDFYLLSINYFDIQDYVDVGFTINRANLEISFDEDVGLWLEDRGDLEQERRYTQSTLTPKDDGVELNIGYVPFYSAQIYDFVIENVEPPEIHPGSFLPAKQYNMDVIMQPTRFEIFVDTVRTIITSTYEGLRETITDWLRRTGSYIMETRVGQILTRVADVALQIGSVFRDAVDFIVNNWEWIIFTLLRIGAMVSSVVIFAGGVWLFSKWSEYWYILPTKGVAEANAYMKESGKTVLSVTIAIIVAILNLMQILAGPFL